MKKLSLLRTLSLSLLLMMFGVVNAQIVTISDTVVIDVKATATVAEKAAATAAVAALANNEYVADFNTANIEECDEITSLVITVLAAEVETATKNDVATATVTKVTFDVQPMNDEDKVYELNQALTFYLPIPASFQNVGVKAVHDHTGALTETIAHVWGTGANKFIELSSKNFSQWTIEDTYTRPVTKDKYGTICLPYASATYENMVLYTIFGRNNNDDLYLVEMDETEPMQAGVPYLFKAKASGEIRVTFEGDRESKPADNVVGLVGTFENILAPTGRYVLSNNAIYYVNSDVTVGAYRAYINMDNVGLEEAPQAAVRISIIGGHPVMTGVEEATAVKATKALVDGQMVIVRGAHNYNVNGVMLK